MEVSFTNAALLMSAYDIQRINTLRLSILSTKSIAVRSSNFGMCRYISMIAIERYYWAYLQVIHSSFDFSVTCKDFPVIESML